MRLTKTAIEKLTYSKVDGQREVYWCDTLPGFGIRVYPSGKKSFVLSYRVKGRSHIKVLGRFGVLTLQQAQDIARKDLAVIAQEEDPLQERVESRTGISFKDFCSIYMERHARHKRTAEAFQRRINKYLIPAFGTLRLSAITRDDVSRLYDEVVVNYPYEANRIVQQMSKMIECAKLWKYIKDGTFNVTKGIRYFKEQKRDRWIRPDELPRLAKAINEEPNVYGRAALWLYLLTGCRRDELLRVKWTDFDRDRKELRISETKAGRVHYVPLSQPAMAILNDIPKKRGNLYILVGQKPKRHLVNIEKIWRRVRKAASVEAANVEDVRIHDLRRTLGSWLAQAGNSLHLIGRVLNHSNQSTTAIYARFAQDHLQQAVEAHGHKLVDIAKQVPSTVVLPIDQKRRRREKNKTRRITAK